MSRSAAFAESTKKNHRIHWKAYILFTLYYHIDMFPATSESISLFAHFLSRSFKSVDSVINYVSGVKVLHIICGWSVSAFDSIDWGNIKKGLRRRLPYLSHQAAPITPLLLKQFHEKMNMSDPLDATLWALFLVAFFAMLRKSNLVPDKVSEFQLGKQLARQDVISGEHCLLLSCLWSKTNQFGQRCHRVPLVAIPNSPLCPVSAFTNMCLLVPAPGSAPAFCIIKDDKFVPLTYSFFQAALKKLIQSIGLDPTLYSSHSFRRGGASWAFACQVPGELIQKIGDWRSQAYLRYLQLDTSEKTRMAVLMGHRILNM